MASAEVASPARGSSPPRRHRDALPRRGGGDSYRPKPKERTPPPEPTDEQKQAAAKAEYEKLLNARSGGVYIPPARLRALQAQITDKTSKEAQRMAWEALKKSIQGVVNKANTINLKQIVPELFNENLVRGRGLLCNSLIKAGAASLPFTPIYAALAAIVNTKIPTIGELLLKRLVLRFRKAFRRNDKAVCVSSTTFIAHLCNQQVCSETLAGQILLLLLNKPTDDSVEIAVNFIREVGAHISEMEPVIANAVFDQFRNILHESDIDKRTQYMIEVLFQTRKDGFKDNPPIKEELDLIEEEDQIKHQIDLMGKYESQDTLNIFKLDPEWQENEDSYKRLKAEILGEESGDDEDDDEDESSEEEDEDEEQKAAEIKDMSNTDLVNLRRTIYLTLQSSIDFEEAVHKLSKIKIPAGQEHELPSMIIECCSQAKTYEKFFGLTGERIAKINRLWLDLFEQQFTKYYETIHRYESNRLRNIARFWGHMFATNAIGWHCLSVIHLNEEETTSASRIFIKILFEEISEAMGMRRLQERMKDETLQPSFAGLFPRDVAKNVRFSINYFTSIGMGALTEDMRDYLANMPKPALPAPAPADDSDSDSVSSYSSYTGSSYSSRSRSRSRVRSPSPSRDADRDRARYRSRSPVGRGRDGSFNRRPSYSRSYSGSSYDSRSPSRSRSRTRSPPSRSRSPLPRKTRYRSRSDEDSRSPAGRRGGRARSDSRSPSRSRSRSRTRSLSRPRARGPPAPLPRQRRRDSGSRSPLSSRSPSRSRSPLPPPPSRRGPAAVSRRRRSYSPRPRARERSFSRDRSPLPSRSRSRSPVPAKRRRRNSSGSRSASPPPVKRGRRYS